MAIGVKSGRIMFQRGTKAEWEASKLILLDGELAIESDTTKIKIGDGKSKYIDLPYIEIGNISVNDLTEEDIAKITGPPGEKGEPGEKGDPGKDGVDGKDGTVNVAEMTESQLMNIKKQLDIPVADDFVDRSTYDNDKASLDTKIKDLDDDKADKNHSHSVYITTKDADNKYFKKDDPIELTSQQKEELKGEPGKDGVDGKPGDPGKGIVDSRSGREIKVWVGDQSDYKSIRTKDGDTLYLIWE